MLNVVIFLVCRNRATHLISSLNNISRLSRRNVFVRQACRMNHCVSVERPRDLSGGSALCLDSIPPISFLEQCCSRAGQICPEISSFNKS